MSKPKSRSVACRVAVLPLLVSLCVLCGCGTTRQNFATEQLLLSDAVDRSVARIDFRPLTGRTVYLDTQYVQPIKQGGYVNANYIISSLRQQMVAARCLLQERRDDAELIVEARVGALGSDGHDVSYGIPPNSTLNNAITLVPNSPALPAIPELSIAKKSEDLGAAKIAVFAYHRETREPYWQSGISQARSTAKYRWIFGVGPFQSGTIFKGPRFAGRKLNVLESTALERRYEQLDEEFRAVAIWPTNGNAADENDTTIQQVEQLLADRPEDEPVEIAAKPPRRNLKKSAVRLATHEEPVPPSPPSKSDRTKEASKPSPKMESDGELQSQQSKADSASESTNHTGLEPTDAPSRVMPPPGWLDSFRRFGTRVNGLF